MENVYIDERDIAEYMWRKLLDYGFVIETEEAEIIAMIMFDFLMEKAVLDEDTIEEYDEGEDE